MPFPEKEFGRILETVVSTLRRIMVTGAYARTPVHVIAVEQIDPAWVKTSPEDWANRVVTYYVAEPLEQSDCESEAETEFGADAPAGDGTANAEQPRIRPSPAVADLSFLTAGLNLNMDPDDGKKALDDKREERK